MSPHNKTHIHTRGGGTLRILSEPSFFSITTYPEDRSVLWCLIHILKVKNFSPNYEAQLLGQFLRLKNIRGFSPWFQRNF